MIRILILLALAAVAAAQSYNTLSVIPKQDNSATGELRYRELNSNGANYVGFKAPSNITANSIWTLPAADGAPGECWKTNGAKVLSFSSCGSLPVPDTTIIVTGSVDATKLLRFEVDGFTTATTRVLTPQDANYTLAGINIAQTFTADQTFGANILPGAHNTYKIGSAWNNAFLEMWSRDINARAHRFLHDDDTSPNSFSWTARAYIAAANAENYWQLLDQAGGEVLKLSLRFAGADDKYFRSHLRFEPDVDGTLSLGTTTKRWSTGYFNGINCNGPCPGVYDQEHFFTQDQWINPTKGLNLFGSQNTGSVLLPLYKSVRLMGGDSPNLAGDPPVTYNLRFPWKPPASVGQTMTVDSISASTIQLKWDAAGGTVTLPYVNAKSYGAVGTGVATTIADAGKTTADFPHVTGVASTDQVDWAAIQEALWALPASGGCVFLPAGHYRVNKALQLGNGADQTSGDMVNTRESTLNGQCLFGEGSGHANNSTIIRGATVISSVTGFTAGPIIQVSGNTYDSLMWGFTVDGNDITAKGIVLRSSYQGRYRNIQVRRVTGTAWRNEKRFVNPITVCEYSNNAAGCITLANAYKFRDAPCLNNFSMVSSELPTNQSVIGFDMDVGCSNTIEDSSFYYGGGTGAYGVKLRFADNNMFRRVNVDRSRRISNGGIYGDAPNTSGYWGFREGKGLYLQSATEDPRMPYENQFLHFVTGGQGIGAATTSPQSGEIGNLFLVSPGDCDGTSTTDVCNGGDILGLHVQDTWGNYWAGWKFRRGIYTEWNRAGDVAGFYKLSGYFGMPKTFVPDESTPTGSYVNGVAGSGWTFNNGATRLYVVSKDDQQAGAIFQAFTGNVAFIKGVGSRGTLAAPTASLSGDPLFSVGGTGYDGTGFPTGNASAITFNTTQNWTSTARGAEVRVETTPDNSTTRRRTIAFRNISNSPVQYFIDGGTAIYEGGFRYNASTRKMQFRHECVPDGLGGCVDTWTNFGNSSGYTTIQDEGIALTSRSNLNLIGAGVSCVDDAGNSRTNCTIPGGSGSGCTGSADCNPTSDDTYSLGSASFRWTSVIARQGIFQSISAREATGFLTQRFSVTQDLFSGQWLLKGFTSASAAMFTVNFDTGGITTSGLSTLSTTVVVSCGTLTFTNGLLTNKGTC